jgi:hypothetical protein
VFGRAALHRLKSKFDKHANWKGWWNSVLGNESVEFFRGQRNYIVKEGPAKVGQVIRVGVRTERAEEHYYFESADVPATTTVEKHLNQIEHLVLEAQERFTGKRE